MNSLEHDRNGEAITGLVIDELLQWELRVAQRADELAPKTPHGREEDLDCWLQAEREVLLTGGGLLPNVSSPSGAPVSVMAVGSG